MMASCEWERKVLRAVARGWLRPADNDVAAHAAGCARCREVRAAAELLRAAHLRDAQSARVLPAAAMWWRLERRRRHEQARRAQRIAFALQALMLAAAAGGAVAVLQMASPWLHTRAAVVAEAWQALSAIALAWSQAGAAWTLPIALGVAAWLLVLPAAVYLVLTDE